MNLYKNPWHNPLNNAYGPQFYSNDWPIYKQRHGMTVYKCPFRNNHFDIVLNDVCISQRCGASDELLDRIHNGEDSYCTPDRIKAYMEASR